MMKSSPIGTNASALNRLASTGTAHAITCAQHLWLRGRAADKSAELRSGRRHLKHTSGSGRHAIGDVRRAGATGAFGTAHGSGNTHDTKRFFVSQTAATSRISVVGIASSVGLRKL